MSQSAEKTFDPSRIRRWSTLLSVACLLLMIVLPIVVAAYWALADVKMLAQAVNLTLGAGQESLKSWQRLAGGLLTEASLALLLIGLWQARKCFRLFAAGQLFTSETVGCLRGFAAWVAASVAAGMVANTAISVLITVLNPPGMRQLVIGVGSEQVFALLFAGMVWLMAAVMSQGQLLAEENATYI